MKLKNFVVVSFLLVVAQIASGNGQRAKSILPTPEEGCGRNSVSKTRIMGGSIAKMGEYPWMALIGFGPYANGEYHFQCGGSLISIRHVLTAAHCIFKIVSIVRFGEYDQETDLDGPTQDIKVQSVARHRRYNKDGWSNDIAILTLEKDVELSSRVLPICLPFDEKNRRRKLAGLKAIVAGWGRVKEGENDTILRRLQLPILDDSVCTKMRPTTFNSSSQICAGSLRGGETSCKGDSGGPLMVTETDDTMSAVYQVGIVSFGESSCLAEGTAAVYAKVPFYIDWIKMIVDAENTNE